MGPGDSDGCESLNIECNDTLEEPPWLEKLCLKDAMPRWLGGGDEGTGDDGCPGRLGEPMVPFLADWATA